MHKREDSAAPDTIGTVVFSFYGSVCIDVYSIISIIELCLLLFEQENTFMHQLF